MSNRNQWLIPAVAGVLGFTGGGALGYFLGRRRGIRLMGEETMKMLSELRSEMVRPPDGFKVDYKTARPEPLWIRETTDVAVGFDGATQRVTLVESDGATHRVVEEVVFPPEEPPTTVIRTLFATEDETWNFEAERSTREGKAVYVIHRDEFMGNEMGYHQATITYYAGDDILVDEADVPMYNFREQLGDTFEFGKGSGDSNVVYIRNERESAEFEVLLHLGRYEIEVLGLEIEEDLGKSDLKHSVPRFRME